MSRIRAWKKRWYSCYLLFFKDDDQIYMLYAYPKSKKDDLTADQLKQLKKLVEDQLL
jgi:hypothetical protein